MNIQDIVISLRRDGMTQSEIGDEIGCSQSAVSDIEGGKIGKTRPAWKVVDGLRRLARKRGIKISKNRA